MTTDEGIDQHFDPAIFDAGRPGLRRQAGRNKLLILGCAIILLSLFLAAFGPVIAPYDPAAATPEVAVPPPGLAEWPGLLLGSIRGTNAAPPHWLGTDQSGLDVFSRIISAPRTDMTISLSGAIISCILGSLLGLLAGFTRNRATELLMRVSDVLQSFPVFILAMILVTLSGRSIGNIVIALVMVYTPIFLRLTRAEVMGQVSRSYVEAARAAGNRPAVVALKHVLPNAMAPSLVQMSVTIGFAIILTAGLSFVGAGVRPPTPEWGLMISLGAPQLILGDWWPSVFPGLAMSVVVFGYAVVGHAFEARFQ
ncbi:MAG: ABC transporter permease [Pseudomonadota bacterium]|nr:ABC transporter permease [Pseudomonadota bacterium]